MLAGHRTGLLLHRVGQLSGVCSHVRSQDSLRAVWSGKVSAPESGHRGVGWGRGGTVTVEDTEGSKWGAALSAQGCTHDHAIRPHPGTPVCTVRAHDIHSPPPHTHPHTCIHTHPHPHLPISTFMYIHTLTYTLLTLIHSHTRASTSTHVYAHSPPYIHTCTRVCTLTYTASYQPGHWEVCMRWGKELWNEQCEWTDTVRLREKDMHRTLLCLERRFSEQETASRVPGLKQVEVGPGLLTGQEGWRSWGAGYAGDQSAWPHITPYVRCVYTFTHTCTRT